jgi:hypothetical protein
VELHHVERNFLVDEAVVSIEALSRFGSDAHLRLLKFTKPQPHVFSSTNYLTGCMHLTFCLATYSIERSISDLILTDALSR